MSRTLATRSVARAELLAATLAVLGGCAESRTAGSTSAPEPTPIEPTARAEPERLTDTRIEAIAALPHYANAAFEFERAVGARGRTVVRLTDDEATLTFTGAVDSVNEVVHGEIPFNAADGLRWAGGGFSGWLQTPEPGYVRGVSSDGAEVGWTVTRYALDSDAVGRFVLTVELAGGDGTATMVAYGRLIGRCEVVDENLSVRRVVRPVEGSLCQELVGWL